jgi:AmmeMemoRadiSam system protein B
VLFSEKQKPSPNKSTPATCQMTERRATHSGTWYSDSCIIMYLTIAQELSLELTEWLNAVDHDQLSGVRAIIGPHAGYAYSGSSAAYAYKMIDISSISRVFILGPSHKVYSDSISLSSCVKYDTPLGTLWLDLETITALSKTLEFTTMDLKVDEAEHSIELHLPFIAKIFKDKPIKIVPMMVGCLENHKLDKYGKILAPYLDDAANLFVISSDFCHWGNRFSYTYRDSNGPIHESIERLDRKGMEIIERMDMEEFERYLEETQNTICGRFPIQTFLSCIKHLDSRGRKFELKFNHYAQSEKVKAIHQSSVSYASAYFTITLP